MAHIEFKGSFGRENMGQIGARTGIYDIKTGEEILIGDVVTVGYLEVSNNGVTLKKYPNQSLGVMVVEDDGVQYVFGEKRRTKNMYTSDKFTNNFIRNVANILLDMTDFNDDITVVWKEKDGETILDHPDYNYILIVEED